MPEEPRRKPVGSGRVVRVLRPAGLAGRAAVRWAGTYAAWGDARRRKRERFALHTAEDVRRTMGDMKGVVMKFGQILSMMSGVLPDEMMAELSNLQSDAPPMDYHLVEQVFDEAYGRSPQDVFRRFEKEPFAAASIGQVHRATLHDGTRVAVKVQYPGVREAIEHDLANVGLLVGFAGMLSRGLDAATIIRELKEGVIAELDYEREAASQQRFYDEFDGHAFIRIPRVYHELTTPRVLVQEFVEGRPFADGYAMGETERQRIAEILFRYSFGSIYRHRLFNGDPHPGNYLLLADGAVAFVDYGCVAEFSEASIIAFKRIISALLADDREAWRRGVEAAGILMADAPFTTEQLYEHMHWYWAPILEEDVLFTPELAAEMVRRNTQTLGEGGRINQHCNVPEGMVFLTRINFGLAGLFAALRARGPWRGIVREYIDGAPPCTELGRLSAATSRGPAV
ncbi:MAG TPA: AarF/ABC1/UbiB kinase family protein [Dehalococcoidia bacterium]|nr:AarF/ABC1/UbiB kinase family protein [Dehalococcoidia bacterium]